MKTKLAAVLAATALVAAGCATPMPEEPVEYGAAPTRVLTVTDSQSMTELLMPPTDAQPTELAKGSLGVLLEDYAPESVTDTLIDAYLPEVE